MTMAKSRKRQKIPVTCICARRMAGGDRGWEEKRCRGIQVEACYVTRHMLEYGSPVPNRPLRDLPVNEVNSFHYPEGMHWGQ